MSESEWATSNDPQAMFAFLRDRGLVSERKFDLFDAACCRRVWDLLPDERLRRAVRVLEDGLKQGLGDDEYVAVSDGVETAGYASGPPSSPQGQAALAVNAAFYGFGSYRNAAAYAAGAVESAGGSRQAEGVAQADLLRDIFGSPFTPIAFLPEWRTSTVVALARSIYEERAWDRMGVLGDALEEAWADPELVRHCREPGTHVRGCHVLDAALDRL